MQWRVNKHVHLWIKIPLINGSSFVIITQQKPTINLWKKNETKMNFFDRLTLFLLPVIKNDHSLPSNQA
jgi:hypothetical protein